jgi:hypothetical protein
MSVGCEPLYNVESLGEKQSFVAWSALPQKRNGTAIVFSTSYRVMFSSGQYNLRRPNIFLRWSITAPRKMKLIKCFTKRRNKYPENCGSLSVSSSHIFMYTSQA